MYLKLIFTALYYAKRGICHRRVSMCEWKSCVLFNGYVSVCVSHAGIVSKWLNVGPRKKCCTI